MNDDYFPLVYNFMCSGIFKVDFANKYIGGGVLGRGRVQVIVRHL
jgi:hypothetical protein